MFGVLWPLLALVTVIKALPEPSLNDPERERETLILHSLDHIKYQPLIDHGVNNPMMPSFNVSFENLTPLLTKLTNHFASIYHPATTTKNP